MKKIPAFLLTAGAIGIYGSALAHNHDHHSSVELDDVQVQGDLANLDTLTIGDNKLSNIYGEDRSVFNTPRSVTSLSAETLEALNIDDLHDIVKIAPNSYAASGFGTPSLPSIRGQLGELYQDGIRRQAGNNGFGLPLSFNSVEQLDVVKGPSPVVFGSSQRNGGFVNLQTKKAPTQGSGGSIKLKRGTWEDYYAQLDVGGASDDGRHGLRLSAEWRDAEGYYDHTESRSENVFIAYQFSPSERTHWDASIEYFDAEYPDNAGINRPTQDLIDHGTYITGQGRQADGSTVPAAGSIISPTGQKRIRRNRVFTHPNDKNEADTVILRSSLRHAFNDDLVLRNLSYYQHLDREEIARNSFVEIVDGAETFENRTELDIRLTPEQLTTVGLAFRYTDVLGYSQFTTEADNPVDLTGPISNREIPLTDAQKARLVKLRDGVYVSPGGQYDLDGDGKGDYNLSDTTDSTNQQTGLFVQQQSSWTDRLSTIAGVRFDHYNVKARDPLAPQGVNAASDRHSEWLQSYQLSANYALTDSLNLYATGARNDATSNSLAGGNNLGGDNKISKQNFATENDLVEVGVKFQPNEHWYAEASTFEQTRGLRNRDGSNSGIKTRGIELQLFYETDSHWLTASYSYLNARFDNSAASQESEKVADAFDNSRPDIINGTGVGSPSFKSFAPSNKKVPGIPPEIIAASAGWNIDYQWSVGASALYTRSFGLDYLRTVKIRDQYNLDLNASYQLNNDFNLRLDVVNVTDEENWQPVFEGGYFGSTLVMPNLPRHAQLAMQYSF